MSTLVVYSVSLYPVNANGSYKILQIPEYAPGQIPEYAPGQSLF